MPFFLVHTVVTLPSTELHPELERRRQEEVVRAHELQESGDLVALWRESGRLASFGIWSAAGRAELDALLASLPMRRHMQVEVTAIEPHPNAVRAFPFEGATAPRPRARR